MIALKESKPFYRTVELAQLFDVSEKTIKRRVMSGEIKSVLIGRCRRIPATEVTRLMNTAGAAA